MCPKPLTAISLYTGAGGLDLGFEAAGFETRVAVEMEADAVSTLRANRDWPVLDRDIHGIPSEEILTKARLEPMEADVLIGGPPCQPFSKSGYWASGDAKRLSDPRATTLEAFLRVVRDVKPMAFLLENVPGIAFSAKSEGLELLRKTIQSINETDETKELQYSFEVGLINAAWYGVPQERYRVFIIGHREGLRFKFPKRSHAGPDYSPELDLEDLWAEDPEPFLTAWDAIADLQDDDSEELRVTGKWADLLPTIPEGQNYLHHTDRGKGEPLFGWRRRYWSFLLKLAKNRPSWTIAAQPGPAIGPFHWKSRRLSQHEMARLQTFPEPYEAIGSLRSVQRQLGNAVPSALAQVLALAMRNQFFGPGAPECKPTLLPLRRYDLPSPEPIKRVPTKYLSLVGEHEPHPGTGKGYAAFARTQ
jgi:DNA (cytosine-5)-methyltransferase 1